MPSDLMLEIDKSSFSDNLSDELNSIKSLWIDSNTDSHECCNTYIPILKSSGSVNSDCLPSHVESFLQEVKSYGFIIGKELDDVKAKSRRSLMQQMSNHISMNFQTLYGKENNGVRHNYFQVGVRVPSKEHVSEIVGKQGMKIKEIREKTGALIITPDESEDHVFIIEATPHIALGVARFIDDRACEITTNRARDNLQKALVFSTPNRFGYSKPFATICTSRPILATGVIEVPKNIVGRIIGTHGSIITTIQKDTGTEIRSPPKDNHLSNNGNKAKFDILVYQKSNSIDMKEAVQRIQNAKQLIAHVAMHQMERIRAEESPFSNYRIKNFTMWEHNDGEKTSSERNSSTDKEKLLNYQMQAVAWLWVDIDRLDDHLSEEVVARILEESKKKSRIRTDCGNFDIPNNGTERFDEISFQQLSPFKQGSFFSNIFDMSPYAPPTYSDQSSMKKSPSPNQINDAHRESAPSGHPTLSLSFSSRPCSHEPDLSPSHSYKKSLSYAEHLRPASLGPPSGQQKSHGVIGDRIKRINPTPQTAQFDNI